MKNINSIIKRSNLSPFERVAALVRNNEHKRTTGKNMLTDAQLETLTQGWSARMGEANEYNKYLEIARLENSMSIDATTFSYKAELAVVRNQRVLAYCLQNLKKVKDLEREAMMQGLTEEECLQFALAHTYLEYRDTLHFFTFENLPLEIRQDLSLLDESVGFNRRYLEEEVMLYDMFKDGKLSPKDRDTLVDAIFSRVYHDGIRKMRGGAERDGFMIGDSFAELDFPSQVQKNHFEAG